LRKHFIYLHPVYPVYPFYPVFLFKQDRHDGQDFIYLGNYFISILYILCILFILLFFI